MRHGKKGRALGRTTEHKEALLRNMAMSLFRHGRIETTTAKAKELRPFAEKLITLAKRGDLHSKRLAARHIQDRDVLVRLFDQIGPVFSERPGGYTRILKTGSRKGDGAETALIELVTRPEAAVTAAAAAK
jgi:large subunit ribosomal protein L17